MAPKHKVRNPNSGALYVLIDYNLCDTYKIGVTSRLVSARIAELNQSPGSAVKLYWLSPQCTNYKAVEKKVHKALSKYNTRTGENKALREWFCMPPEVFSSLVWALKNIVIWDMPKENKNESRTPDNTK
jgi:T5orf172 domain